MSKKLTTKVFVEKAKKLHGDRYGYDEVCYTGGGENIIIYCKQCKEYFSQVAHNHLRGHGHKQCRTKGNAMSTTKQFIEKAKKIHGDKYGYDQVFYTGRRKEINIYCNKCKQYFSQKPDSHLRGVGCRICSRPVAKSGPRLTGEKYADYILSYISSFEEETI